MRMHYKHLDIEHRILYQDHQVHHIVQKQYQVIRKQRIKINRKKDNMLLLIILMVQMIVKVIVISIQLLIIFLLVGMISLRRKILRKVYRSRIKLCLGISQVIGVKVLLIVLLARLKRHKLIRKMIRKILELMLRLVRMGGRILKDWVNRKQRDYMGAKIHFVQSQESTKADNQALTTAKALKNPRTHAKCHH